MIKFRTKHAQCEIEEPKPTHLGLASFPLAGATIYSPPRKFREVVALPSPSYKPKRTTDEL